MMHFPPARRLSPRLWLLTSSSSGSKRESDKGGHPPYLYRLLGKVTSESNFVFLQVTSPSMLCRCNIYTETRHVQLASSPLARAKRRYSLAPAMSTWNRRPWPWTVAKCAGANIIGTQLGSAGRRPSTRYINALPGESATKPAATISRKAAHPSAVMPSQRSASWSPPSQHQAVSSRLAKSGTVCSMCASDTGAPARSTTSTILRAISLTRRARIMLSFLQQLGLMAPWRLLSPP